MPNLYINFYFFIGLFFFIENLNTHAQSLTFISSSDSSSHQLAYNQEIQDIQSIKECIQNHGYWNVIVDSISTLDQTIVYGKLNAFYQLSQLSNANQLDKTLQHRIKSKKTVYSINSEILSYYVNKGYPFVDIQWSIDTIMNYDWIGQVLISPNDKQYIDSLIVKSEPILKLKKWDNILISKNLLVTKKTEIETDRKLKSLSFIELNKPSKYLLTDKKNLLFIYPKKKKVNSANGLLAFTNDQSNSNSGFTGNFNIHLENILKSAEVFDIRWKAGNANQDFKWNNSFKYVYHTLGLENEIHIYKQDSTYTQTQLSIGLRIDAKPQSTWIINYQFEQSAVNETSLTRINYTKHLLNLSWLSSNLESNYFDRKGYQILLKTKIGNRYTNVNTEAEYQIHTDFLKIIPLSKTLRLVGDFKHKQIIQDSPLENNAFSFGGFENMKGFIENRFLTTRYSLFTPTLRFSQQNKYIAELFYQIAYIKTFERKNERLESIGLQFILPVKSGWFNFGVSSGRIFPEAFHFNQALIHFGIKNNL